MCMSWLAGPAPPVQLFPGAGGTPKCPQCSSGSAFVLFSPRLPSLALPTSSLFPASSVLLFLNSSNMHHCQQCPRLSCVS